MFTIIISVVKGLALLTYLTMIVIMWTCNPRKIREFFEKHKVLRTLIGGLAILGGILFLIDLCTGKIT